MPDDVVWLTYEELGIRLGIGKESARQKAKRGHWARRRDNHGRLTVAVPAELLEPRIEPDRVADRASQTEPDHVADHEPDTIQFLNRHVERLEEALDAAQDKITALEKERDQARAAEKAQAAIAAQVEALNAILAVEKRRADDLVTDRDAWRQQAERLSVPVERRPWWRRLAG